jgi:acylphosphatase
MTADTPGRIRLVAYGGVQGVGFRYFVREHARRAGLAGYVRNRPDGAVELEAAGPADRLATLRHTVTHGPPGARVSHIDDLDPGTEPLPATFEIRR